MKTEKVTIKKFKAIENLEQEVNGNHILLLGDNGVGKSSVIQFIEIALGKQTNIPPNAEGSGEIVVTKDGNPITFKLDFRDGKPYIKVSGKGISIDNKKGAIAELVGALDFDVDEFVDLSKTKAGRKEQVEIFKGFLPKELQDDLAKFEADLVNKSTERTELGREIKKLEGSTSLHKFNNLPNSELLKIKSVDTVDLMSKLSEANKSNDAINKVLNGIEGRKQKIERKESEISELKAKITALETEISELNGNIKDGKKWLKTHKTIETGPIELQISEAGKTNEDANMAQSLLRDRETLETYRSEYGELTALIDSSREAISNAIKEQEGPIDNLTYEDDQLVYNGLPVTPDTLSTGEIMELGIRLKMAENPDLGILFIQRGESLGSDRLKRIKELADSQGWQLIMEQVERGTKELHIEIMAE